jgi:hypothetical protein
VADDWLHDAARRAKAAALVDPVTAAIVPAARAFHRRVVRYLVAEAGMVAALDADAHYPRTILAGRGRPVLPPRNAPVRGSRQKIVKEICPRNPVRRVIRT